MSAAIAEGMELGQSRRDPGSAPALSLHLEGSVVSLGYVLADSTLYLVARERAARWPVVVLREGRLRAVIDGRSVTGRPTLITDPSVRSKALARFREKYGAERYARWYDRPARVLSVRLDDALDPSASPPPYESWLEAEFDNVADDYDHHITGNRMNLLLRNRSLSILRPLFERSHRLIEIGCGSGMETLPLLRDGHEILAVDISQRMLDVVRAKAAADGISERLTTIKAKASELDALATSIGTESVDGGYSTYGALNCEPDLGTVARGVARFLAPGAPFVAGVYNRWCLFEIVGYGLTFRPGRAFGRLQRPVPVGSSRFCVDIFAYSTADLTRSFGPWFDEVGRLGVPVLLPPSDLTGYAEKFARHFDGLATLDAWVGRRWPLRSLGDHFLITLRRRRAEPGRALRPVPSLVATPLTRPAEAA